MKVDGPMTQPDHGDLRQYDPKRRRALDLLRFMHEDRYLVRRKQAFIAAVERKLRTRRYKAAQAPTLWGHWIADGLVRYLRAHPRVDGAHFTPRFVRDLAREVAVREHARIKRGDYPDMTIDGSVTATGRARVARW
jgi:hypothetical protein